MKSKLRWLSIPDVTDLVLGRTNKVAERLKTRSRKRQLEAVRRMVARAESRDDNRITKRMSGDIYVRLDAIENLLPADSATVTRLEVSVVKAADETRKIWRHVGAHGTRLRDHDKRIKTLEEEQALTSEYLERLQAIRSRTQAAG
jgi:hypothetical protein